MKRGAFFSTQRGCVGRKRQFFMWQGASKCSTSSRVVLKIFKDSANDEELIQINKNDVQFVPLK